MGAIDDLRGRYEIYEGWAELSYPRKREKSVLEIRTR